jgi:NAD(P)-dependent dehydrogenase (short-subunit alcohol dehydrogenase family)
MQGAPEAAADSLEFNGKRVLVTGGTKGIGEAVGNCVRDKGATVITTARSRPGNLTDARLFIAADVVTAEGCAPWPLL